jgi:DNA polymerase III subunit beta
MKFTIHRETLLVPLQQAIGVVERRQTLPILGNLFLQASKNLLTISASDLEVEIRASIQTMVDEPGETTIPARKLLDICKALPEGAQIEFAFNESRVQIRSGKSRFTLATLPGDDFPLVDKIQGETKFTMPQEALRHLIERTSFSMAQQDVRYYLNGLLLELSSSRLRAVATDGHRLATCDADVDVSLPGKQQVIVPRKGIHELVRLLTEGEEPVELEVGTNHLRATMRNVIFTSKLVDGRFPDYERVIPKGGDKKVLADRELMRQALIRTSILSNEKYRGVRLTLETNTLKIQTHNPEQEEADEEFEVEYGGKGLEIGFNVTYLLDVLASLRSDQVEITLSDANSSCLVQQPDSSQCRYVVMPMRL